MNKTYRIPSENLPGLLAAIEKLNKRAARVAVALITVTMGVVETVAKFADGWEGRDLALAERAGKVRYTTYQHITLTGETPKLSGWMFAATLQHLDGAVLLRTVPGVVLPVEYRTADPSNCDHCHKKILTRKETFIVYSETTRTWAQVGRTCIADFLGGKDPHAVAAMLEFILEADALGMESEGGGSGRGHGLIPTREFLATVAALIRHDGWISRAKAIESMWESTSQAATRYLTAPPRDSVAREQWKAWKDKRPVSDEDWTVADKALNMARTLPEPRSDYEHNLFVAAALPCVENGTAGILASVVKMYLGTLNQMDLTQSKHAGAIGERAAFEVRCLDITVVGLDSMYGPSYLHKMTTRGGDLLVWFGKGGEALKRGEWTWIKATPKEHSEYRDVKQTVVSRLSVMTEDEIAKMNKPKRVKKVKQSAAA